MPLKLEGQRVMETKSPVGYYLSNSPSGREAQDSILDNVKLKLWWKEEGTNTTGPQNLYLDCFKRGKHR